MFEILGELLGSALMAIFGWFAVLKPDRLVGHDGSPNELQKRVRYMKFCGVGLMICGSLMFVFRLLSFFVRL